MRLVTTLESHKPTYLSILLNFFYLKRVYQPIVLVWIMAISAFALFSSFSTGCNNPVADIIRPQLPAGKGSGLNGMGIGPAAVSLGVSENFILLAQTGISNTSPSVLTGNLGLSPADATNMAGFELSLPASTFTISKQVDGKLFAANYEMPTPITLNMATLNMDSAYLDAAQRDSDYLDLQAGQIGGLILPPAVYKWSSNVFVSRDINIDGGPNDVWIFQISGDFLIDSNVRILLTGGASANNIYWQILGAAELSENSHFEGILLSNRSINLKSKATANGRLLAKTFINLNQNKISKPTEEINLITE
jgi:hypothetical protein